MTLVTPLVAGKTANVQVTVADPDGTGFVSLFIDFNGDGDFADAGEVVLSDAPYPAGAQTIPVAVPAGATGVMGVRVRLADTAGEGGASPTGRRPSGEVEDYLLGSLGDYVWDDTDGDGIQNERPSAGRNGVTVKLLDSDGNPGLDGNATPITT